MFTDALHRLYGSVKSPSDSHVLGSNFADDAAERHTGGANVLNGGGNVKSLSRSELDKILEGNWPDMPYYHADVK
ncbi:MAG: hypothetical protein J6S43_04485 [Lentisphaeria bacterium]|nr:hypothetical protein [Lentisphaeria bacterium]